MSHGIQIAKPSARLFAIGDIHGCIAELETLLTHLTKSLELNPADRVIFIGDYIDRGRYSKEVVDLVINFRKDFPDTVFLKGNHEDMLLHYLGFKGSSGEMYLKNGGGKTLQSYGAEADGNAAAALEKIPMDHLDFFKSLEVLVDCAEYYFVHAGLNPKKAFKKQAVEDLYWIREGFIDETHNFGKTVVFGHTPHAEVIFDLPWKIGIDTGLVYGNMLSCVELKEGQIYQVARKSKKVDVRAFPFFEPTRTVHKS